MFALYAVLANLSLPETAFLTGLYALCVVPIIGWYLAGMKWIPLGEAFVLLHLLYYVLPPLAGRKDWLSYSESEQMITLMAVALFLVVFLAVYRAVLRSSWKSLERISLFHREMRLDAMGGIFGLWIVVSVLQATHLVPNLANYRNVFDTFLAALGVLGIAYIFYQLGRGKISSWQRTVVIGGFIVGMAAGFVNGYLQGNVQTLGVALLAYTLGGKQVPVSAIALSLVMLTILQLGKHEFRASYWNDAANDSENSVGLVERYETWLGAGWEKMMPGNEETTDSEGLVERASLIQILALAMKATPAVQPFLNGKTYLMLPELLVPRIFWPDKPRGTLPTETIGIYYGIQTEAGATSTGISVGPLAEAWANLGWCGMVVSASFFGLLFGLAAKVSLQFVPSQVGWLLAAIILNYSIKMEACVAEIASSLLQMLLVTVILLFVLSHPPTSMPQKRSMAKSRRPITFKPAIRS